MTREVHVHIHGIKDWEENKHPRASNGEFGSGGGSSGSGTTSSSPGSMTSHSTPEAQKKLKAIAAEHSPFSNWDETNSSKDFKEVSVGGLRGALAAAYKANGGNPKSSAGKKVMERIAKAHSGFTSLEDTNSGDDFKEMSPKGMQKALEAAYRAGGAL